LKIGQLEIKGNIFLAPMAGITNLPFRTIAREFGCSFAFTEMISATGLVRDSAKSYRYLDSSPADQPLGVQIFGSDPGTMAEAARIVAANGASLVDINMGCPVRKVVQSGAGAALMKDPERVRSILQALRVSINLPLSVKIRSGWNKSTINAVDIALIAQDCGVDAITIHPRTAEQGFSGSADWQIINQVQKILSIPVIGSGDIRTGMDVLEMKRISCCDAFMVGRGSLGNPWIFQDIAAALNDGIIRTFPSLSERRKVMHYHLEKEIAYAGEKNGCKCFRKHLLWYTKGLRGGGHFRQLASSLTSSEQMKEAFDLYLSGMDDCTE